MRRRYVFRTRAWLRVLGIGTIALAAVCIGALATTSSLGQALRLGLENETRAVAAVTALNCEDDLYSFVRHLDPMAVVRLRQQLGDITKGHGRTPQIDFFVRGRENSVSCLLSTRQFGKPSMSQMPAWLAQGELKSDARYLDDGKGPRVQGFFPVHHDDKAFGILMVELDADTVTSSFSKATAWILGIALCSFIVYILGARWFSHHLALPITQLTQCARALDRGLDVDLAGFDLDTDDELQFLGQRLRAMTEELCSRDAECQRVAEGLRLLDRIREEMLSSISHELRTPITSILAYGEILSEGDDVSTEQQHEFSTVIYQEAQRLASLVGHVLDLNRYDLAPEDLDVQVVDLRDVVQAAVDSEYLLTLERHCVIDIEGGAWGMAAIDAERTTRALRNLINNAIRFAPLHSAVDISFRPADGPEERAEIRISDEGMGIPEDMQSRVFELFYQACDFLEEKPPGLGVGLPLARICMRSQGGELALLDSGLLGSTFALCLPCQARVQVVAPSDASSTTP